MQQATLLSTCKSQHDLELLIHMDGYCKYLKTIWDEGILTFQEQHTLHNYIVMSRQVKKEASCYSTEIWKGIGGGGGMYAAKC